MLLHSTRGGPDRFDEAEAAIRKALELDPQFPWGHTVLSRVYLARSRPQEAMAEACRVRPDAVIGAAPA